MTAIWFVTIEEAFFFASIAIGIASTLKYLRRRSDRMLGTKVAAVGCVLVAAALFGVRSIIRLVGIAANPLIANSPVNSRVVLMLLFSIACFLVILLFGSFIRSTGEAEDRAEGRHYTPSPSFAARLRLLRMRLRKGAAGGD